MARRCVPCDRDFGSQQALQQHLDSPVHVAISEYSGIPRSIVESVYAVAKRLRFIQPTVGDVLRNSKFELGDEIVAALISAAQLLLPVDNTEQGIAIRTQRHLEAKRAEENFCTQLLHSGHIFLRENEQLGKAVTPDVLFHEPTLICGHLCFWLEYKDSIGFRSNPFVAASTKKQLLKYASQIGPGAVVYKQGYETGHLSIQGVMSFREKEILEYLRRNPEYDIMAEHGGRTGVYFDTGRPDEYMLFENVARAILMDVETRGQEEHLKGMLGMHALGTAYAGRDSNFGNTSVQSTSGGIRG